MVCALHCFWSFCLKTERKIEETLTVLWNHSLTGQKIQSVCFRGMTWLSLKIRAGRLELSRGHANTQHVWTGSRLVSQSPCSCSTTKKLDHFCCPICFFFCSLFLLWLEGMNFPSLEFGEGGELLTYTSPPLADNWAASLWYSEGTNTWWKGRNRKRKEINMRGNALSAVQQEQTSEENKG